MALRRMEPKTETVGRHKFYITPFSAFKAANMTGELASVLAPLLGAMAPLLDDRGSGDGSDGGGHKSLMDIDAGKAAQAMMGCSISGDKLEKLTKKLLLGGHIVVEAPNEDGEIEPQTLDMDLADELFCGDVQDMFILCFHVIKLNFNGFFKKFAALSGKGGAKEGDTTEGTAKAPRMIL